MAKQKVTLDVDMGQHTLYVINARPLISSPLFWYFFRQDDFTDKLTFKYKNAMKMVL